MRSKEIFMQEREKEILETFSKRSLEQQFLQSQVYQGRISEIVMNEKPEEVKK